MGKFEIKTAKDGQNYFNLKASNGQIILSSEMYTTMKSCENGIASVKKNAPLDERYELKQAENGKFHFNLKAGNHQVIGSSVMFATEEDAKAAIAAEAKALLEVPAEIYTNEYTYSKDPLPLISHRNKMGEYIEKLK